MGKGGRGNRCKTRTTTKMGRKGIGVKVKYLGELDIQHVMIGKREKVKAD